MGRVKVAIWPAWTNLVFYGFGADSKIATWVGLAGLGFNYSNPLYPIYQHIIYLLIKKNEIYIKVLNIITFR